MWVFYALAGPIALGMVVATLQYFAASTVPLHVRWIVGYAWFCTISIIILVPADIWTVRIPSLPSPLFLACPHIHLCKQTLSSTPTSPFYSLDFSKVQSWIEEEEEESCLRSDLGYIRMYARRPCATASSLDSLQSSTSSKSAWNLKLKKNPNLGGWWYCHLWMQTVSPTSGSSRMIGILWSWSYWSTFILTWYVWVFFCCDLSSRTAGWFCYLLWIANWHKPDHSSEIGKPISPGNNITTWKLFYFFVNLTRMMSICSWGAKDLFIMFVEHMHGKWSMLPEALICIWTTIVRFLVPLLQGYEDAGDFTVTKRLKTSVQGNLMLYGAVGVVSMIGVFIMVFMGTLHW